MGRIRKIKIFLLIGVAFSTLPFFVSARSYGEKENLFVEQEYDKAGREDVAATIRYISTHAYFYIEDAWWENLALKDKNTVNQKLEELGKEFDKVIYPRLTSFYGYEWRPGIDSDYRIAVLFHQTKEGVAGYFKTVDEYPKTMASNSNEKEMVYLSVKDFEDKYLKSYLAHEFTHLITFNQKDRLLGKQEDVWLNELRADYSPTLLGYDDEYTGTNLQKRLKQFLRTPSDSLVEWKNRQNDYGVINVFSQYLTEHYGTEILRDSMRSPYTGIASLNYALKEHEIKKDFSEIFTDWAIAVFVNDCSLGEAYCFTNDYLKSIRVAPSLIFLPSTQESRLSLIYAVKEWSGHWYKIVGGNKGIKLEFQSLSDLNFTIPYLIEKADKIESVEFLKLDKDYRGTIELPYFGQNKQSLIILPSIQEKTFGFSDSEPFWRFSLDVSTFENGQTQEGQENQENSQQGQGSEH